MRVVIGRVGFWVGLLVMLAFPGLVRAQEQVWVQIEAQPTLEGALDRVRAYDVLFPDTSGYQLTSGWYGIVLGPYGVEAGAARLADLRRENLIPSDSFIADGRNFARPFWPEGRTALPELAATPLAAPEVIGEAPLPEAAVEATPPEAPAVQIPEETPAEARRSEAALSTADREALQVAMQWFGFYTSAIDGDFGPGTRKAMAAWQSANAQDPTGILTTLQRESLLEAYALAQAELGLQTVTEEKAGITLTLPTALVAFERYDPPFVHYAPKNGSGVQVILISEPGDQAALYGLYDVLQTLEIIPLEGERSRNERGFTLTGRSASVAAYATAELSKGLIKGYVLVWNAADDARMERVLAAMQASFASTGDRALDPGLVPLPDDARKGMLSGLEVRRPEFSRSGFFIDAKGTVLTTVEAVQGCGRITVDRDQDADLVLQDAALGLAVLRPRVVLSPPAVAGLAQGPGAIGSEIAVSGYSYEDTLSAPVLSFGKLADTKGLNDEPDLARLTVTVLPGDAGGPVLDGTGAVVGMLLPRAQDQSRLLPPDLAFAASAASLSARLAEVGVAVVPARSNGALAPEDLARLATGMTVLVSCWN